MGHVGHANHGLLGKTLQLRRKQRRLKLAQPVVEANRPMVKFIGDTGPASVDIGLYELVIFEVIGEHDATFPGGDQFARLKTEGSQVPDRTRALAAPLSSVSVGAI